MRFDDDEDIVAPPNVSALEVGETELTIVNKPEAPLEETELKLLVELSVSGDNRHRYPVDLVAVLDVSGSMQDDDRIGKLKIAMQFLVRKLSPIDRLSVVTFSKESTRLFPLRKITGESQKDIIEKVNALEPHGATNIAAGLRTALHILEDRRIKFGRVGAIMLMSDGEQTIRFGDARQVQIGNFAVYTFGFGSDAKPDVLQKMAENSNGGTFSDVRNNNDLSKAFSQCLAGLLTLVVRDLKLTITPVDQESEIKFVSAGNYPQTMHANGSITVSFAELYNNEVRSILVGLLLPKVDSEQSLDVLQVTCTGSAGESNSHGPFEAPPEVALVTRTGTATDREVAKMILEENRLKALNTVKEARLLADNGQLPRAKDKLDETKTSLEDVKVDDPTELIKTLIYELQQLSDFMRTPQDYEGKGRSYAMSFDISHDRQRYAARGDIDKVRSFATPGMDLYLEQAKNFDEDPTKPLPSALEDDVERERDEILDNPYVPYHFRLANLFGKSVR